MAGDTLCAAFRISLPDSSDEHFIKLHIFHLFIIFLLYFSAKYASQRQISAIMSTLIQSRSTIGADQPVPVRPVSRRVNLSIHQRHAEPGPIRQHLPSDFLKHSSPHHRPRSSYSITFTHASTHADTHTHTRADSLPWPKNETFPCNGNCE